MWWFIVCSISCDLVVCLSSAWWLCVLCCFIVIDFGLLQVFLGGCWVTAGLVVV